MKINWTDDPDDDGTHDLCGTFGDKYVDVVRHEAGHWAYFFNDERINSHLPSRDVAKRKAEQYLCRKHKGLFTAIVQEVTDAVGGMQSAKEFSSLEVIELITNVLGI